MTIENLRIALPDGRTIQPVPRTRGPVTDFAPATRTPGTATITWQVPQMDGHVVTYSKTYVFDESALDERVGLWRDLIADALVAIRSALAAWR